MADITNQALTVDAERSEGNDRGNTRAWKAILAIAPANPLALVVTEQSWKR